MNFKLFERDIFGFEELEAKKEKEDKVEDDSLPVKSFNVEWMMDVLSRQKLNGIKSTEAFLDHVSWGNDTGAIRVRLTPNIAIYIERLTQDLEGAKAWIMKRIYKAKLKEFAGKEEEVAYEVFDEVKKIFPKNIDSAAEKYSHLLSLTKQMVDRLRVHAPSLYSYRDTKQITEDHYLIYFSISNAGVGKLITKKRSQTLSPEVTIDVNFNKEKGLIHVIMRFISFGSEGQGWELDIPFLDTYYAPSQKNSEIIDTVLSAIKYY